MNNFELLDSILLSDNVVEKFYKAYSTLEFKEWLTSILPEVEDCAKLKQNNPWHIYNCLEHILHSVEEMNKQTKIFPYNTRKMLAYTMFYHDMGKPACHIRRFSKLYGRQVDSFFNHNEVSTKIAKRTLSLFGFDNEVSQIIQQLVYKHDIFMFITLTDDGNPHHKVLSTQLLLDEIDDFDTIISNSKDYKLQNKTLMKYLIMVGRADNLAQNPQMTQSSLYLLDTMEHLLDHL